MKPHMRVENDYRYLTAARNGFNKNYCSGTVSFFTAEEIAKYESTLKSD